MNTSFEWIEVCTMANGGLLRLPVHTVEGAHEGPSLGVVAAIHGDEIVGIEIGRRIAETVDRTSMRGRIRFLPVANPPAFEAQARHTPLQIEQGNLNKVFPGTRAGDPAHLIARSIVNHYFPQITHLICLHGGGTNPIADFAICLREDDVALARALGHTVIHKGKMTGIADTMEACAVEHGIPAVVAEAGGGFVLEDHYVRVGARGILNVMKYLGMLDGSQELPPKQYVLDQIVTIRPTHGGLLYSELPLDSMGKTIGKGTLVGRVVSPYTFETLEELRSPFEGIIILLRPPITRIIPGEHVVMMANIAGARIYDNSR